VRRREFLLALGALSVPTGNGPRGQTRTRLARVGALRINTRDREIFAGPFRKHMTALGWEEQRNISYIFRWAEGRIERLPALAQELVAEGVDLIVVTGNPGIKAAQDVTATIPVVGMSDDLVEGGLAVSMSRPGGNTTGVSIFATDLDAKRLEVLHECVPQARHIGILVDPTTTSSARQLDRAARDLSLELRRFAAKDPLEIERALDAVVEPPTDAVNVLASPVLNGAQSTIVRRLNEARLPSIYQWPETAVAGGLLGYGPRRGIAFGIVRSVGDGF
jgi:putative tryptophan/tyrosine transport system substrate-binding protein